MNRINRFSTISYDNSKKYNCDVIDIILGKISRRPPMARRVQSFLRFSKVTGISEKIKLYISIIYKRHVR